MQQLKSSKIIKATVVCCFIGFLYLLSACTGTKNNTSTSNACIDPKKIDKDAMCITLYNPVCGCDGQTYGNECEARRAGLLNWTPGECKTDEINIK